MLIKFKKSSLGNQILDNNLEVRYFVCNSKNSNTFFSVSPGEPILNPVTGKKEYFNEAYAICDKNNVLMTNNPEIINFIFNVSSLDFEYNIKTKGKEETKKIINELFVGVSPFDNKNLKGSDTTYCEHYLGKHKVTIEQHKKSVIEANKSNDLYNMSKGSYYFKEIKSFKQRIGILKMGEEEVKSQYLEIQNLARREALNVYNTEKNKGISNAKIAEALEKAGIAAELIKEFYLI